MLNKHEEWFQALPLHEQIAIWFKGQDSNTQLNYAFGMFMFKEAGVPHPAEPEFKHISEYTKQPMPVEHEIGSVEYAIRGADEDVK